MNSKATILLNKTVTKVGDACPTATADIKENVKNRNWTIDNFAYVPLNPAVPDLNFWEKKADMWIRIRVKRNLLDQDPEGKIVENAQKVPKT